MRCHHAHTILFHHDFIMNFFIMTLIVFLAFQLSIYYDKALAAWYVDSFMCVMQCSP